MPTEMKTNKSSSNRQESKQREAYKQDSLMS